MTVSALGVVACSREAAPTTAPGASASATSNANVDASGIASANADARVRLEDYPRLRNVEDAQKRAVFRGYTGDTCYVELPWPKGKPRMPGQGPPTEDVACPAPMKAAVWERCRGGSILAKNDGSDCICFQMGNPPPLPTKIACP